jgi:hypothetical protein
MAITNSATVPTTTPIIQPSGGRTLFYPIDMGADPQKTPSGIDVNRPIIMFRCEGRVGDSGAQYIGFPIPQGIDFSDAASYDDATLGYSGAAAMGAVSTLTSGNITENSKSFMGGGGIDQLKNQVKGNLPNASSLVIAASSGLDEGIKSGVGIAMKMTMNRHIVTEFTGIGTRSFGFKFKLVGSSRRESEIIRDIGKSFRNGLYPEADVLALKYPPKWTIRFMMGSSDIDHLPKIWECYLTALNVSYNGSANLWHTDGAPIECDISVSFKETRALRHQDIRALENNSFLQIPEESRNGYKIPPTETLFSNSGNTELVNPEAAKQNVTTQS